MEWIDELLTTLWEVLIYVENEPPDSYETGPPKGSKS